MTISSRPLHPPYPAAANTGGVRLRVVGFGQQAIVDTADIVAAVQRLPEFHLCGLNEIRYEPPLYPFAHATGDGRPPPMAEYLQRERRVSVYAIESVEQFLAVLFHEIGHHVFFIALNSRVKKRWVTEVSPGSGNIISYAAHNPNEDFAETYAAYAFEPDALKQALPAKHRFMRDDVFADRPGNRKESSSVADAV